MACRTFTAATFVNAVHRRLIVTRAIEQLGRGILFASVLAILLVTIARWQTMPVMPILIFCGAFALLIGSGLTIYRWPSQLTTAMEADRQLGLDDLLTSALFSNKTTDEFFVAVTAMADARCRMHLPSEVVLRRLGIRNWSAVVLTMGIAITLAAIPMSSTQTQAVDTNSAILSADNNLQQSHGPMQITNDPMSESASNNSISTGSQNLQTDSASNPVITKPKAGNAGGGPGGGSTTAARSHQDLQTIDSPGQSQNANGTVAGGGDESGLRDRYGKSNGGGTNSGDSARHSAPEWTGSPPRPPKSNASGNDSQIPPEDRDLVHDFFDGR
jgi:hypothetical protein